MTEILIKYVLLYVLFGAMTVIGYYSAQEDSELDTKKEVLLLMAAFLFWPLTVFIALVKGSVAFVRWWAKLKDE